jgi:uncharacterized Ntn-hydrolase superfamily protein
MLRVIAAWAFLLGGAMPAGATWSVMALDRNSGTIVVASAACTAQRGLAAMRAKGLMDIEAIVVPGRAVAVSQADFDQTRDNQKLIYAELAKGTDPERILESLIRQDPAVAMRQVAILDMEGRHVGFSGPATAAVSLHDQGQVPGTGIWYSIQGDAFPNAEAVPAAVQALTEYKQDLAERVMAAMEAADAKGGDRRCSCQSEPRVSAVCETRTAQVAYMLRAEKADANSELSDPGRYAMYINVTDEDIKPAENANPVKTLRLRYEEWKRTRPN